MEHLSVTEAPHSIERGRLECEMSSSQHKSPHQARAFVRGVDVVTSAEINSAVKHVRESARGADLTIRRPVKANIMSVG